MALRLNTTLKGDVVAEQCYAKIVEVFYSDPVSPAAPPGSITIVVAFYFSQEARDTDVNNYVEARPYYHVCGGSDSRSDLYTWLKAQDDFSEAYDIMDGSMTGDATLANE